MTLDYNYPGYRIYSILILCMLQEFMWSLAGRDGHREKVDAGGELQIMLQSEKERISSGDVCLLAESPFRILRVLKLIY